MADTQRTPPLRGLWLARELPSPADSGDKIYSAGLAKALAEAGADLTLAGLVAERAPALPADWPIRWHPIPGRRTPTWRALLSAMPLVAAVHATRDYQREVRDLARRDWDFVVFDQYGTGWALDHFRKRRGRGPRPLLVHVAHDHEASVCTQLFREFRGSSLMRLGLWQNQLKVRAFERALAARVDLITAITDEDARRFNADAPGIPTVVLTPGYDGVAAARRPIGPDTPRRVVMVGSFRWTAKQENLRRFLAAAEAPFARQGIELQVAGAMPAGFAAQLGRDSRVVRLLGFVDDIEPLFDAARIAVVPEAIGGGFKLKFLDYIFGRIPVATLGNAAAGLPQEVRKAVLCRDDLDGLVQAICAAMDDLALLNGLRERALEAARDRFRWPDRGQALLAALRQLAAPRATLTAPALQ
ncbi:glycosyltransferase [Candidatus Methylocalor cossyra]|uniref:Glycosyl transferase family 4 n=1 Tax=Candidatus Methylocalor cossyra TaxID=3108543 RepID=A0ABP1C9C4_9GAMM